MIFFLPCAIHARGQKGGAYTLTHQTALYLHPVPLPAVQSGDYAATKTEINKISLRA